MGRLVAALFLLFVLAGAIIWWAKFDHQTPQVVWQQPVDVVGRNLALDLVAKAGGRPGLKRVIVELSAGGKRFPLFAEDQPAPGLIGSGVQERPIHVEADLGALGVPEGTGQLEVSVETHAWHVVPPRPEPVVLRTINIDLTPPTIELLTTQHNLSLGGSGAAVLRVSPDAASAEIEVADYRFPVVRGYFQDPNAVVALFGIPPMLPTTTRPRARVVDAVGNVRTVDLPCRIRARSFADRSINIDDAFLQRKVPELLAANGLPAATDLVAGYLEINRTLRQASERKVREVTKNSLPNPLWDGVFHRQSNSAPMSGFADQRTYMHEGQAIDHQTHLGFDLASVARAPIEATQNGVVVFAGNLGIYGETVILDHGLGIFSLYGHLSSIGVRSGDHVERAKAVGQSGDTGLAGGDHLHFSTMIHGVHVDPREWWDGKWIRDHVTSALKVLPAAATVESAGANQAQEPAGAGSAASEKANEQAQP